MGMMTSGALATEELASSKPGQAGQVKRFTLTEAQMDELTAGVCIGNCPGNKTQVGVNACVITRNCQPKNEN
jgi:hypothetical protein